MNDEIMDAFVVPAEGEDNQTQEEADAEEAEAKANLESDRAAGAFDEASPPDPGLVQIDPSTLFTLNFNLIYRSIQTAVGAGKSVRTPTAEKMVELAAYYANLYTQIELQ